MAGIETKSFEAPDETRTPDKATCQTRLGQGARLRRLLPAWGTKSD